MPSLNSLKKDLNSATDINAGLADMIAFGALLVAGGAGGTLTTAALAAACVKAASGATKVIASLLSDRPADSVIASDKMDRAFLVMAQKAYMESLQQWLTSNSKRTKIDREQYQRLSEELKVAVVPPNDVQVAYDFGWSSTSPLSLYTSYSAYVKSVLTAAGRGRDAEKAVLAIEERARKELFASLANGMEAPWLVNYLLLIQNATILETLQGLSRRERANPDDIWQPYLAAVAAAIRKPIWGEEDHQTSIGDLFIEPDYRYHRKGRADSSRTIDSAGLTMFLLGLLSDRRPSSELVFVMGGPGSGKTSLMDMFAGSLAATRNCRVVLVAAKRLNPSHPPLLEVQALLRGGGFAGVADSLSADNDIILIVDGFDELAYATRDSLEAFFRRMHDLARDRESFNFRVILTGRPTLFAADDVAIPEGSHVVTLLPFDRTRTEAWCERWRKARGCDFDGSGYSSSASSDMREIASQPMHLYLLARMHEDGQAVPTDFGAEGAARFAIYKRIIDWICRRQEQKQPRRDGAPPLRRFLQLAGLATHQSGSRVLHWKNLRSTLQRSGVAGTSETEADTKAYGTILSFAFSSTEQQAWEFTHKSFGEALAAEAIQRVLEDLSEPGRDGETWRMPPPDALATWIATFGPHFVTTEIAEFVYGGLLQLGIERSARIVLRAMELHPLLLSAGFGGPVVEAAETWTRTPAQVLANALRGWFAIVNTAIGRIVSPDDNVEKQGETLVATVGDIELRSESVRQSLILCHFTAAIGSGDFALLLQYSRLLLRAGRRYSEDYVREMARLKSMFVDKMKDRPWPVRTNRVLIEAAGLVGHELGVRILTQLAQAPSEPLKHVEKAFFELDKLIFDGLHESPSTEIMRVTAKLVDKPAAAVAEEITKWVRTKLVAEPSLAERVLREATLLEPHILSIR